MDKDNSLSKRINPYLIGILGSVFLPVAALIVEPRLLPLAMIAGPALTGLALPPNGRRVYRELGIAMLLTSAVISVMLFMPAVA